MSMLVHSRGGGGQNWLDFGPRSCWMTPNQNFLYEVWLWKYWKLTQANIMQNTFSIMNRLYVYTVCSVHDIFPLVFPRGLAEIEFDLGPKTVRVSMASKRFAILRKGRESLWNWTCIQKFKMILCNQKYLHTYLY